MPHEPASHPQPPVCLDCAKPMRFGTAKRDTANTTLRRLMYVCDDCGRTEAVRTFGAPSEAERCEAKAAEFRLLAAHTADPFVRKIYFELAEELEYLNADFNALDDRKPDDGH